MNSRHHRIDARLQARMNAVKKRNLQLKYISLNGCKKSRSEPALTKRMQNPEFHKRNYGKIKKTPTNRYVQKKIPQVHKKYPNVLKNSPNFLKESRDENNSSAVQKVNYPHLKFANVKSVTKRASIKSKQKIKPCTKQGGFTEKIVSMWYYAKSFLGLSSTNRQNPQTSSVANNKSKQNIKMNITSAKPKKPVYVAKKSLIHHNKKDLKEMKNISLNQRYLKPEKYLEKCKIITDGNKQPLVIPNLKTNKMYSNMIESKVNDKAGNKEEIKVRMLQNENNIKSNLRPKEKEQIKAQRQFVLKQKNKKDIINETKTYQSLKYETKPKINIKTKEKEQTTLNPESKKDKILIANTITSFTKSVNKSKVYMKAKEMSKKETLNSKKNISIEINNNRSLINENKSKVNIKVFENDANVPKKNKTFEIATNQSLDLENKSKANKNEEIETEKQTALKNKTKKNIPVEMNTNRLLQLENKPKVNIKTNDKEEKDETKQMLSNDVTEKNIVVEINTNQQISQHENKTKISNEKDELEMNKQILLKDKLRKDIIVEINTNRPLCEISSKSNCYKSSINDTNATIIIEIKNAASSIVQDTKQMQPQTLNVNYAIETLDVHTNADNCEKNVLTLLNTCNVKQNNITQLLTRGRSNVPVNKMKKTSPKVIKVKRNLTMKKQRLTKKHKKHPEKSRQHLIKTDENSKSHKKHRSCERHHYRTKHNCRHHKIKHISRRKCATCRGYISTDHSQERRTHREHRKDKHDYKKFCYICNKRVSCLYHHNKKNHQSYDKYKKNQHEKKIIKNKNDQKTKCSKKHFSPMKNKSQHYFQKKKRTLTVCTNSRRNSFKNKKLKRSVTYISTQIKPSTSKILPRYKYSHNIPHSYVNYQSSTSSMYKTDTDSDSDRHEVTKVLSWWYLHYALNAVRHDSNEQISTHSDEIEENRPFLIPYGEFCNVYQAISKADFDSDNSSSNENWDEDFEASTSFPKHPNSFTDEETMVSENIYPDSSFYSSIHNFEESSNYDIDTNTSIESSLLNLEIPNNTPQKSATDLQAMNDE